MQKKEVLNRLSICLAILSIAFIILSSSCSAAPASVPAPVLKQFNAHNRQLMLTNADTGQQLIIKSVSKKEGVCRFEEVFEVTAIGNDYVPIRGKDFGLKFMNKTYSDIAHEIRSVEWYVWEDNRWQQLKWDVYNRASAIKNSETKLYKVVVTKKRAELGDKRILTVPKFMGVEDERLTWWNVSWQYKKSSELNNVPTGGYTYQLRVHSGVGTNTRTDVYLNGHGASNFKDIRFVLDETTELDYWIEDSSNSTTMVFVDVPHNGTVYMYYGNPNVETTSDISNIDSFIFFDDFEDGDVSDWSCYNYVEVGSAYCSLENGYNSNYSYRSYAMATGGYNPTVCEMRHTCSLSSGANYKLSVFLKGRVSGSQTHENYFKINDTTYWSSSSNVSWTRKEFDISGHAGTNILLKFGGRAYSSNFEENKAWLWIDNVLIRKCLVPEPEWQLWTEEQTEGAYASTSPVQYNTQRKIVRTSDGYLHRVYTKFDGSHYRIYYAKSTDGGSTWTETDLSEDDSHDFIDPSIAVDSNDNIWVVYSIITGIRYRIYNGVEWSEPQSISEYAEGSFAPSIAIDEHDNVHVAWCVDWAFYHKISYRMFNGTSWSSIETLDSSNYPKYPSIAVDANNYVHVVWQEKVSDVWNIKHRKKTDSGWQAIYSVTNVNDYDQTYPCIVADPSGNVHVVWQTSDHQIKYRRCSPDGTWNTIETVYDGGIYEQFRPSISVYDNNYLHVVWFGYDSSHETNYVIKESHKTTGSWSSPNNIVSVPGKDVVYPNLIGALYPKFCSDCYTNLPDTGYAFIYDENGAIKYYDSDDLAWRCPTKYTLTLKAINAKTGISVTSFSADLGTGETKTTTNGVVKFRCLETGYYSLRITANGYYVYTETIVVDTTKEMTVTLTPISEFDYYVLPNARTVTFIVEDIYGKRLENIYVEAVGYNITHPYGWLGSVFGFTNETEIYSTRQNGTTDSNGEIAFLMADTIKYKVRFINESLGINKTWFKYPTRDEYTIIVMPWEYSAEEERKKQLMATTVNITTAKINSTHAIIYVNYTDPNDMTESVNINITRLEMFGEEEVVYNVTITDNSFINESFIVTPYKGRSFNVKIRALHEGYGERIWEYGVKFKGLLKDLELPEEIYPIIAIAIIFFIGGLFGATTALQGSLLICIVSWIFYGIGWLNIVPDSVMVSALSLATVMSVLGLLMDRARRSGVQ